jgi:dihydrofolate reductase
MAHPDRIEGLAIVSSDGMIADRDGVQPDALKIDADQRFFHEMCDAATALAHGHNSGEGGPRMAGRRRLVLTRNIASLARHPDWDKAVLWNPAGATLEQAWDMLGLSGGLLAVIGGTEPFGMFLDRGYDAFHLSTASQAMLPGGRPVFPGIPPHAAEELLTQHRLTPGPARVIDASHGLSLVTWSR